MANIIIFGHKDFAELAYYFLTTDSEHTVSAFCVNEQYLPQERFFHNLRIVSFETVEKEFPTSEYSFFVPMTYRNMNRDRELIFQQVKAKGYQMISYISSNAKVAKNVLIGENTYIMENVTIQPYAKIGNNVVMGGCFISHHSIINDNVFIAAGAVICGHCIIEKNTFIGANASVRDLSIIGEYSFIGLGSIISKNMKSYSVYASKPAEDLKITSLEFEQLS